MEIYQPASREHTLGGHVIEAMAQEFDHRGFSRIARSQGRVPAFARQDMRGFRAGNIAGHTQSGAGRQQDDRTARIAIAVADGDDFAVREVRHTPGESGEIIDERNVAQRQEALELLALQHPGRVRELAASTRDRTRHRDHGLLDDDALRLAVEKVTERIDGARIGARRHRFDGSQPVAVEKREPGARPADVGQETAGHAVAFARCDAIRAAYHLADALGVRACVA